MDYKEIYKETLRKAKEYYADVPGSREFLDNIFPELSESEDERIRKFLIDILSSGTWKKEWPFSPADCVAYLEKQKEQKDYRKLYEEVVKSDWFKENYVGKSLGEDHQPAEWSEEDEQNSAFIVAALDAYNRLRKDNNNSAGQKEFDRAVNWIHHRLKSLRPSWKPCEEQMDALRRVKFGQPYEPGYIISLYEDLGKL